MAILKECIYFYIYSESTKGDGVYNCTSGFDSYSFGHKSYLGMNKIENEQVRQIFMARNLVAYKYNPADGALLSEYLNPALSSLKQRRLKENEPYRGDDNVTRIVEDIELDKYYVCSALTSSYFTNQYPISVGEQYVNCPDLSNPNEQLPLIEQDLVFKNDLDLNFIANNRKEYLELLRAFMYSKSKGGSLYIEIGDRQYEKGKSYIENIIKFFPIKFANSISFSTLFLNGNDDIVLFFSKQGEEVKSYNRHFSSNVMVKLADVENFADGVYLKENDFHELSALAETSRFEERAYKQIINEFLSRTRHLDISGPEEIYKLLLAFIHLYDEDVDYNNLTKEIIDEIEVIKDNYHLTSELLGVDNSLIFARLIKLLNYMLPQADTFNKRYLEELIVLRYRFNVRELDELIYDLILSKKVKKASDKYNFALADLMFDVGLLLEDVSKYREEYFFKKFKDEDFALLSDFIQSYLKESPYSEGLLSLLQSKISENILRQVNKNQTIASIRIIDKSLDSGFKSTFLDTLHSADESQTELVIEFYLSYIFELDNASLKSLYFEIICDALKDSYPFNILYTQLINLKLVDQRRTYFLKSMGVETPILDEATLVKAVERFNKINNDIHNETVNKILYQDFLDLYIKSLDLDIITFLDLRHLDNQELQLYVVLKKVADYFSDRKQQEKFLNVLEERYIKYQKAKQSEEENRNLIFTRIDFIVDNFVSLGDKKMMKILSRYIDKTTLSASLEGIEINQSNQEFLFKVREIATNFLAGEATSEEKVGFAEDVREAFEDNKLTSKMTFKEFGNMVAGYIGLLVILLGLDVGASFIIYQFVLKNSYVFLLGAVTLLNILAMSILYVKNQKMRMFRNPFIRTLWQSIVITIIMFAALYGAISLFALLA